MDISMTGNNNLRDSSSRRRLASSIVSWMTGSTPDRERELKINFRFCQYAGKTIFDFNPENYFESLERSVSAEKRLMPLSVFIEAHLCVSRLDEDA